MFLKFIFATVLVLFTSFCSKDENIYQPSIKLDPYKSYNEGLEAFEKNQFFFASKKFTEAETNFNKPALAAKSAVMSSYMLYRINFYVQAEENLKRYIKKYPADKNIIYAHYLLAIMYFEQIGSEEHDLKPLLNAEKKINFFINKYPESEYAIDLRLKKNLVINQFAARELHTAKYYISVQKWVPAINRLKLIVRNYDETIFIEEALHRLVEIHYHIGLEEEAKKFANILGYNYNSSEWYKQSYKIFNKKYQIKKPSRENEKNNNLLDKIIKIIK